MLYKDRILPYFKKNFIFSGAIAGAISTLIFTCVHQILISDIWYSFFAMFIAGVLCGICVGLSYNLLFKFPSFQSWIRYNFIFFIMLMLSGIASIIYFEPVTIVAALIQANSRPDALIKQAGPMTVIFTVMFSVVIGLLYAQRISHYLRIFITCLIIMFSLGLNISILGLVYIPTDTFYLIIELLALILVIIIIYVAVFLMLERRIFFKK